MTLQRQAHWQPEDVLVIEALNRAPYMINLHVAFRGSGKEVSVRVGIFPGWPCTLPVPLSAASGATLFLPRTPGRFKATVSGANLRFDELEEIEVAVPAGAEADVACDGITVQHKMPVAYRMPRTAQVDALHQWRARSWPGKARGMAGVRAALGAELQGVAPAYPAGWSPYGGWNAKRFDATGFFRTQHDGRRWWLVDPQGCAFWSIGVDCIRAESSANVAGIEQVFKPALPDPADASHLWTVRDDARLFNALAHNLERAWGPAWREQWLALTARRLRRHCVNTIGNWSDPALHGTCGVPYVFTMAGFPRTATAVFRDFPDVYAGEYQANSRAFAAQLTARRDDRAMIGYFMTNEPQWAFVGELDIGAQILMTDTPSATRDALISMLSGTYRSVAALNAAWGARLASFADLAHAQDLRTCPGHAADTRAFTKAAVERYVRVPAEACRAVDAHHLNLGLRWAWIHSDYQMAGAGVLDAFSINCYQLKPDAAQMASLAGTAGKPIIIGEFHIGSLDRGLPSGGIRTTRTMAESVKAYQHYLEHAAALPDVIGAHYFQWNDQHVMGRFDGENMQIGLHDITGRPYPEWQAMCAALHPSLYAIANGDREPGAREQACVPHGTLCW
mgnify:CR=1 FL=1